MILSSYLSQLKAEEESLPRNQCMFLRLSVVLVVFAALLPAATAHRKRRPVRNAASKPVVRTVAFAPASTSKPSAAKAAASKAAPAKPAVKKSGPWRVPNFADSTEGDVSTGEDMVARQAAIDALGKLNGSVVVADAASGRILSLVNQKLALKSGFQPCSTIKVPVALAALSETVVDRTTLIRLYGKTSIDMTQALAKSSNQYFASLGEKLGFERVSYYAKLFGLGETASDIDGEQPGLLPPATPKSGMGMMTSFGDGITLTPLEFAALMGAIANGGTLYYLQHPRSAEDADGFLPRVKRHLEIAEWIPEIKPGMLGAVEYGTARRIGFDPNEPIYGKTGTCTDTRSPTHLGWFGSFTEAGDRKVVVVVLLTGGNAVSGPAAAGVAGQVYKNLDAANYFARAGAPDVRPVAAAGAAQ
jgi:penicillin-binding protein 2